MKRSPISHWLFLFLTTGILCAAAASTPAPAQEPAFIEISLKAHQTLWDIAAQHADDSQDIRQYIYKIRRLNDITDPGALQPGQIIRLPAM